MARLLPSRFFSLIVRNMIWPRIDWKIWFLLVCFYREEIKFNAKKLLLSSRTWLMSWEREEKKVPVRVNSEEVNKNPIWELKRITRQMVYHPSKYRLFSCLNPLVWSEECAVSSLCSSLSQRCFDNHLIPWSQLRLRGRGWGCWGVCRRAGAEGNSWQDQGLAPRGT